MNRQVLMMVKSTYLQHEYLKVKKYHWPLVGNTVSHVTWEYVLTMFVPASPEIIANVEKNVPKKHSFHMSNARQDVYQLNCHDFMSIYAPFHVADQVSHGRSGNHSGQPHFLFMHSWLPTIHMYLHQKSNWALENSCLCLHQRYQLLLTINKERNRNDSIWTWVYKTLSSNRLANVFTQGCSCQEFQRHLAAKRRFPKRTKQNNHSARSPYQPFWTKYEPGMKQVWTRDQWTNSQH